MIQHERILLHHNASYPKNGRAGTQALDYMAKYFKDEDLKIFREALESCWKKDDKSFPSKQQISMEVHALYHGDPAEKKNKKKEDEKKQLDMYNKNVDEIFSDMIQRVGAEKTLSAYNKYVEGVWPDIAETAIIKTLDNKDNLRRRLFMPTFLTDIYEASGRKANNETLVEKAIEIGKQKSRGVA